jgi:hypothetical protein
MKGIEFRRLEQQDRSNIHKSEWGFWPSEGSTWKEMAIKLEMCRSTFIGAAVGQYLWLKEYPTTHFRSDERTLGVPEEAQKPMSSPLSLDLADSSAEVDYGQ